MMLTDGIFSLLFQVLYESHSVIHGRPFPLKGSFYAVSILVRRWSHAPLYLVNSCLTFPYWIVQTQ
jgi:hypothetical protein